MDFKEKSFIHNIDIAERLYQDRFSSNQLSLFRLEDGIVWTKRERHFTTEMAESRIDI